MNNDASIPLGYILVRQGDKPLHITDLRSINFATLGCKKYEVFELTYTHHARPPEIYTELVHKFPPDPVVAPQCKFPSECCGECRSCQSQKCNANKEGDCEWAGCPQLLQKEPETSGRSCPRWTPSDEERY